MKQNHNLPIALRWTVFLSLLLVMTGCASLEWILGSAPPPDAGGCRGRKLSTTGTFGPYGYQEIMGHRPGAYGIYSRDMGFAVDEPHFIPITRSRDSN